MADDSHVLEFTCTNCEIKYRVSGVDISCPSCDQFPSTENETKNTDSKILALPEGESSSEWPGWKRWNDYGDRWPEIRKKVLERDGYQCVECGVSQQEHKSRDDLFPPGKGLHIHHIEPFSNFDDRQEANRLENLEAVCDRCHKKKPATAAEF